MEARDLTLNDLPSEVWACVIAFLPFREKVKNILEIINYYGYDEDLMLNFKINCLRYKIIVVKATQYSDQSQLRQQEDEEACSTRNNRGFKKTHQRGTQILSMF